MLEPPGPCVGFQLGGGGTNEGMRSTAGAGFLSIALAVIAVLAGCGSSASASERVSRCVENGRQSGGDAAQAVSSEAWNAFVRRACRESEREHKLTSKGDVSAADAKDIARRHPEVVYPLCEDLELQARSQLQPDAAKYVPPSRARRIGHHLCDLVLSSPGGFEAGRLTGPQSNALARQHPELLAPYCLAGAQASFDGERRHVFTRRDLRMLMQRVCTKAVRRGYIRPVGEDNDAAVRALARAETLRAIRRGEIHPLSTS